MAPAIVQCSISSLLVTCCSRCFCSSFKIVSLQHLKNSYRKYRSRIFRIMLLCVVGDAFTFLSALWTLYCLGTCSRAADGVDEQRCPVTKKHVFCVVSACSGPPDSQALVAMTCLGRTGDLLTGVRTVAVLSVPFFCHQRTDAAKHNPRSFSCHVLSSTAEPNMFAGMRDASFSTCHFFGLA